MNESELTDIYEYARQNYETIKGSIIPYVSSEEYYSDDYYSLEPFYFEHANKKPGKIMPDGEKLVNNKNRILKEAKQNQEAFKNELNNRIAEMNKDQRPLSEKLNEILKMGSSAISKNLKTDKNIINSLDYNKLPKVMYKKSETGKIISAIEFSCDDEYEDFYEYQENRIIVYRYKIKPEHGFFGIKAYFMDNDRIIRIVELNDNYKVANDYFYENERIVNSEVEGISYRKDGNNKVYKNQYEYSYKQNKLFKITDGDKQIIWADIKKRSLVKFLEVLRADIVSAIIRILHEVSDREICSVSLWYAEEHSAEYLPFLSILDSNISNNLKRKHKDCDYYLNSPWEWNNTIDYEKFIPEEMFVEMNYKYQQLTKNENKIIDNYLEVLYEIYQYILIEKSEQVSKNFDIFLADAEDMETEEFRKRFKEICDVREAE